MPEACLLSLLAQSYTMILMCHLSVARDSPLGLASPYICLLALSRLVDVQQNLRGLLELTELVCSFLLEQDSSIK